MLSLVSHGQESPLTDDPMAPFPVRSAAKMDESKRLRWSSMSVDEYAAFQAAMGQKVQKVGGVWWRQVRTFFYRPLLSFRELNPKDCICPPISRIGGAQYTVPNECTSNSSIDFLIFQDPHAYSMESLAKKDRYCVRRAMKTFTVKPIVDPYALSSGHEVYLSFYSRTKYGYKSDRTDLQKFTDWAHQLFQFPKVKVNGAYRDGALTSISVSYVVEDILFLATLFSKTDALSQFVSDLMLHSLRTEAAESANVSVVFATMAGRERGLDEFYLLRGARLVRKPARLHISPLALLPLKIFKPNEYLKLQHAPEKRLA
jgi:hypothetical protein